MRGLGLGVGFILLAYAAAFLPPPFSRGAPWLMVFGLALFVPALFLLGTRRRARRLPKSLRFGFGLVAFVLLAGFGAALALGPEGRGAALWLGLPRRAALLLYGIGLLPALVLPLCYALSFDTAVLNEAELAEWRSRLAELEEMGARPPE